MKICGALTLHRMYSHTRRRHGLYLRYTDDFGYRLVRLPHALLHPGHAYYWLKHGIGYAVFKPNSPL